MNIQRAQNIAGSPVMANVTYNGVQIYIQNVDENNNTAKIYPLEDPQKEQEVAISSLEEN
jgi:small acid-soluble spore protein H (minor)